MENMIILNSGQKIDVVFQDHVTLDIDCTLRYIKSGEAEINSYVVNTAQPQLDQVISSAQINMAAAIAKGIEDASLAAENAAASAIDNSIEHAETAVSDYVAANITPMLEHHVATSANSASSAATSANSADASATNAALSADAAGASATVSLNSANAASASEARINNVISNAADEIFAQLSNPFSLLDYKFSEYELSNASWLLSNGQFNSGAVYQSVYNLLLQIYNGTVTKAGVSVKLSTETYADTDFVLDTTDTTFRLPLKVALASGKAVVGNGMTLGLTDGTNNFSINTSTNSQYSPQTMNSYGQLVGTSSSGSYYLQTDTLSIGVTTDETKSGIETSANGLYLYFYVGEVVQDANIIAAGQALTDIADLKAHSIVETYQNGDNWYRIYSDGWCEQGGLNLTSQSSGNNSGYYISIPLLVEMADSNYTGFLQAGFGGGSSWNGPYRDESRSTTSTAVFSGWVTGSCTVTCRSWMVCGYIS